jgi:hypothetical protein
MRTRSEHETAAERLTAELFRHGFTEASRFLRTQDMSVQQIEHAIVQWKRYKRNRRRV